MTIEAMKLALEALEWSKPHEDSVITHTEAIAALKERLAQRTEQNFCPRCGKRTNDIHTCTPPQENT